MAVLSAMLRSLRGWSMCHLLTLFFGPWLACVQSVLCTRAAFDVAGQHVGVVRVVRGHSLRFAAGDVVGSMTTTFWVEM